MEQLRQRVIAACHLGPMDGPETRAYILHRLRTVGWDGDPAIDDDAFAAIYGQTGGIPRRINIFCNRLLLLGFMDEKHVLNVRDVATVVEDLAEEFAPAPLPGGGIANGAGAAASRRSDLDTLASDASGKF
jgi:predicted TIM-barrel enzyme